MPPRGRAAETRLRMNRPSRRGDAPMPRSLARRIALVGTLLALVAAPPASAEVSSAPDKTFVTDGSVNAVVRTADKIYLGGSFTQVGPRTGAWAALSASSGAADAAMPEVSGGTGEVR